MSIPLSVLDLAPVVSGSTGPQALKNTLELARLAERLGYTRYWLAEHHNTTGLASMAPEIIISQVARETSHIRVGSGGVMLPNHAPLKVAETFRTLEAFFPGRIDLGIGRAPGTDGLTAFALRRSEEALSADDFPDQLAELQAFGENKFPSTHPFHKITAGPPDVTFPPVWLLGSSDFSARLAAELGLGFAFAAHFSPYGADIAMKLYRDNFTPSVYLSKPHAILATSVICADTDERAEELAASLRLMMLRLRSGERGPIVTPQEARDYPYTAFERMQLENFRAMHQSGNPATIKAKLEAMIEKTEADEVMVTTMIHSHQERMHSYELLAEVFGLAPVAN
jgi:luciferase family oxidoreductase group 1